MDNSNKAIVFDRRDLTPSQPEDERDKKIKTLESNIRILERQLAHLKWVVGANIY